MAIGSSVSFGEAERCRALKRAGSFFFLELVRRESLELLRAALLGAMLCEYGEYFGREVSAKQ